MADSCCCMTETSTALHSNILQLKANKNFKKEFPQMWEWGGGHFKAHLRTYSLILVKWKIRLKNLARRNLGDIQQSLGFRLDGTGSKTPKCRSQGASTNDRRSGLVSDCRARVLSTERASIHFSLLVPGWDAARCGQIFDFTRETKNLHFCVK